MPMRVINRSPGRTANAIAEQMNEFGGPLGAARQRCGDFMHLLDKRLSLACFVMASPASHAKLDDHSHPLCRQVLQMTLMPAVTTH
jgi:hypothetical protein